MLMNKSRCKQRGVTLVELMIGMLIGLLVIAIVGTVFINIVRSSSDTLHSIKLNDELRSVMNYMTADIRRAGYWAGGAAAANDPAVPFANPFTDRDGADGDDRDIRIHANRSCVMYSYDHGADTADLFDADNESPLHGFWLDDGVIRGVVPGQVIPAKDTDDDGDLEGGDTSACGGSQATVDQEALTDPNVVNITTLEFSAEGSQCRNVDSGQEWRVASPSDTPACSPGAGSYNADVGDLLVETRQIRIRMVGQHAEDPDFTIELDGAVKVRNNRIVIVE